MINRGKMWKQKVNEEIKIKEWDKHFRRLLGEMGWKVVKEEKRVRREGNKEGKIEKGEIRRVMRSLNKETATGGNKIPSTKIRKRSSRGIDVGDMYVIQYGKEQSGQTSGQKK